MKFTLLFLVAAIIAFLYLVPLGERCSSFSVCGLTTAIIILLFLSAFYTAITSNVEKPSNVRRILWFSGIFLSIGLLITLATWPVTYFEYFIPCKDGAENCSESEVIGYISLTSDGALKKLNDIRNKFDGSIAFISRGTPWPGLYAYYGYTALRDEPNEPFYIKAGHFNEDAFTESIFAFSYLIAILMAIIHPLRFILKIVRRKIFYDDKE